MLPYEFSAKVEAKDLRYFNLYSFYHRPLGFFVTVIGLFMFASTQWMFLGGGLVLQDELIMTLVSLVVLLYMPLSLVLRARGTHLKNPVFTEPLHYTLEEEGLKMTTNVDLGPGVPRESKLRWENVYKVVRTRHELLIFSSQINAFVIPLREIEDQYSDIRMILSDKLEDHKIEKL